MIYPIFILLVVLTVLFIWYSFTHTDINYYTDIITSLMSCVLATIVAYICFIGIDFNSALSTTVQYDFYRSTALGLIISIVSIVMLIFFITKILELTHKELNEVWK